MSGYIENSRSGATYVRLYDMRASIYFYSVQWCAAGKVIDVTVIDDPELQDGFESMWPLKLVASKVSEYIRRTAVRIVITFDNYGVSGHPNHIAVHHGVRRAISLPKHRAIRGYQLISSGVNQKFLGLFDATFTEPAGTIAVHASGPAVQAIWAAMWAHWSQFVWFRVLFLLFSRYSYVNTYSMIEALPANTT